MMLRRTLVWFCLCGVSFVMPLSVAQVASDGQSSLLQRPTTTILKFRGRIVHVPVEGGFYGIVSDRNAKYLPDQLPEAFRQDGIRVNVEVALQNNRITLQMWGKPVKIIKIAPEQIERQ